MSVKHVKEYYQTICDQYTEMLENLQDAEKSLEDNIVDVDYVDRLKSIIAPMKDNYERWSYMMFLLNTPNRKSKIPAYKQRMNKFLSKCDTKNSVDATIDENTNAIKNIKQHN